MVMCDGKVGLLVWWVQSVLGRHSAALTPRGWEQPSSTQHQGCTRLVVLYAAAPRQPHGAHSGGWGCRQPPLGGAGGSGASCLLLGRGWWRWCAWVVAWCTMQQLVASAGSCPTLGLATILPSSQPTTKLVGAKSREWGSQGQEPWAKGTESHAPRGSKARCLPRPTQQPAPPGTTVIVWQGCQWRRAMPCAAEQQSHMPVRGLQCGGERTPNDQTPKRRSWTK